MRFEHKFSPKLDRKSQTLNPNRLLQFRYAGQYLGFGVFASCLCKPQSLEPDLDGNTLLLLGVPKLQENDHVLPHSLHYSS